MRTAVAGMPRAMRKTLVLAALLGVVAACSGTGSARRAEHRSTPSTSASPSAGPSATGSEPAGGGWHLTRGIGYGGIQGFADRTSVAPGDRVTLRVSTRARSFVVRAFRMGWYAGTDGRLVWTSHPVPGRRQPPARVLRPRNTAVAPWRPSLVVDTSGWLPGDYLFRLDAANGDQGFVPLTVRGPSARGAVVLVSPVTTWQAYNTWGCCDLYQGADGSFATRARAVSFDRPYAAQHGAGEFLTRELPVLAEAERLGLRLDYVTDVDLHARPHLLDGARAVISMGHDEYWSVPMRAAVTRARDQGTNVAFLGANAVYRRIRFESSRLGADRVEVNYKVASEDPMSSTHPALTTADWPAPPHPDPESSLTGAMYDCFPVKTGGVVVDPTSWLFDGTGVRAGTRLPGLVGPETDRVQPRYPTPRPIEVLLHSPFYCPRGWHSYADTTYYTTSSGAAVFDAGTIDWACDVGGGCRATRRTARVVRRVTDNLLRAFAAGPAGRAHPAHDNLRALGITRSG